MDWIERLNGAINHIEAHLTEEIDYEKLGQIACCSSFHFQRMFGYMAGMPLSEYIRRRKMSRAAVELQGGDVKVIDVALRYGYESPTAFTRAFQSIHGFAPSLAKTEGVTLKSFPPIRFQISIKGAGQMDYRIEKKEAFRVVGVSMPLEKEIEKNFESVPVFWNQAASEGIVDALCTLMNSAPQGVLGISAPSETCDTWRYFIAVATTLPAGKFEEYTVPAATWAVFPGEGQCRSIQELEKRIVTDWLPTSGYEYDNAPDIEVYLDPNPENTKYEVWIPIQKKND
ncbi:AraC family transcriptional regulator [Anoxynatronum buryatiense]|uniref:Transcriptional regulator, AraC family n=1 Tax=Anoxynatronum buryatiense TaxID=489973 RepID=A0AA45WXY8_9CLOT|nr:AraC family transcriptional regulator [Anoxynatronum buryatiense]SMP66309.1 transcriptional regulator, AraC family [Anoxynatronum buryatiense]